MEDQIKKSQRACAKVVTAEATAKIFGFNWDHKIIEQYIFFIIDDNVLDFIYINQFQNHSPYIGQCAGFKTSPSSKNTVSP